MTSTLTDSRAFDRETNPHIAAVHAEFPELFAGFSEADWDELYSCMGMGGGLSPEGVRVQAGRILQKKNLLQKLELILETHLSEVAASLIETLFQQIQFKELGDSRGWQPPLRNSRPGHDLSR